MPILSREESPSLLKIEYEDVTITSETDGGYEFTRPRHTRVPRRTIESGWINISHADFLIMDQFFKDNGKHTAFSYTLWATGEVLNVRFADVLQPEYTGVGTNRRWDIKFKVREV